MHGPNAAMWMRGRIISFEREEAERRQARDRFENRFSPCKPWATAVKESEPQEMYGPPTRRAYWLGRIGNFLLHFYALLLIIAMLIAGVIDKMTIQ